MEQGCVVDNFTYSAVVRAFWSAAHMAV